VLDTTLASTYGAAFLAAHGGSTAAAETALFAAIAAGKAYVNVHSTTYPGGEIRGFLTPLPLPTETSTWGNVKALYR
jgi:hypothetical protein